MLLGKDICFCGSSVDTARLVSSQSQPEQGTTITSIMSQPGQAHITAHSVALVRPRILTAEGY